MKTCDKCGHPLGQRTLKQNNALHQWFEWLAAELNLAGLEMRTFLKEDVEIPWTAENVKNHLWRPFQKALIGERSTTKLSKGDVSLVYDALNRHLGEKKGIHVPFPSENDPRLKI